MRYQDWDVILFPEGSNIPFQEFKVSCLSTQDPEFAQFQRVDPNSRRNSFAGTRLIQLPIVAGYIPSIPWGLPFRVSIHSWETPRLSQPLPETVHEDVISLFEARVVVDGCCVAVTLFKPTDALPQVIDTTIHMDQNGNRDSLRFPPFYPELIRGRNCWSVSENIGRIKIIIAEGFGKFQSEPVFERVKNIVCFNFQHAPLVVWEHFQVAWPNPRMWFRPRQLSYVALPVAVRKRSRTGPEAHAHSPRDRVSSRRSTISTCTTTAPVAMDANRAMPPPAVPDRRMAKTPDWNTPMNLPDPFIDNNVGQRHQSFGRRSGSEDITMPDYSHSITPAGSRDISWMNQTDQKAVISMAPTSYEQLDTISNTISVRKDGTSGTFAPGNGGRCSNVTPDVPTVVTKPSAAAEARVAPRGQRHGRQTSWKGRAKSTNRKVSDVSMKSRLPEDVGESQDTVDGNIHTKPAGSIKGKKEGRGNDSEAKQPETSTEPRAHAKKENAKMASDPRATASEGKRKRDLTVSEKVVPGKGREVQSSPIKQVLRKVSQGGCSAVFVDDLTVDDGAAKAPLQVRTNVQ